MSKHIFRSTLIEAWHLTWKNSALWLLGLLSALFAGSFGLSNFFSQLILTMGSGGLTIQLLNFNFPALSITKISAVFWLIWLCGLLLVMAVVIIYISVNSKTALLIYTTEFHDKKILPKLSETWNRGLKFFWRIFTIEIIRKVALLLIGLIFGLIWLLLPFQASTANLVLNIIALALTIFLALASAAVTVFAAGFVVVENKKIGPAFRRAWDLLHNHLLVSLEISAFLTLMDILLIIAFATVVSFAFVPSSLLWILAGIFGSPAMAIFGLIFGIVLLFIFIALIGGFYNAFYTALWMGFFSKMRKDGILSRLFHHVVKLFKW